MVKEGNWLRVIPAMITSAGPAARQAWDAFVTNPELGLAIRHSRRQVAILFFKWLGARGLRLPQVTPGVVEAFLGQPHFTDATRMMFRSALRKLFAELCATGAVARNPVRRAGKAPLTPAAVRGAVRRLAPDLGEGTEAFDAAMVVLAALTVGSGKVMPVARLTGLRPMQVARFAGRLRASGIWTAGGVTVGEAAMDGGRDAMLVLYAYVAAGVMDYDADSAPAAPRRGDEVWMPPRRRKWGSPEDE